MDMDSPLPYRDTKPQGAADFYFAINATFRFIREKLGTEGLVRYWQELGRSYLKPVYTHWKEGGLPAIVAYWRAFYAAEPGAEVEVLETPEAVIVKVAICPAIAHLRKTKREIVPEFCQHCYFVSEAAANEAGYTVRVCGGAGTCTQTFYPRAKAPPPQDLSAIRRNESSGNAMHNPQSKIQN